MNMEGALRARLLAAADVSSIVTDYTPPGGQASKAIFWVERPQESELPAITLQIVVDERTQSFTALDGLQPGFVQIDGWASSYAAGKALKEAVIAALLPPHTGNGIAFSRAFVTARDLSERSGTETIHRTSMDFTFHYRPA